MFHSFLHDGAILLKPFLEKLLSSSLYFEKKQTRWEQVFPLLLIKAAFRGDKGSAPR